MAKNEGTYDALKRQLHAANEKLRDMQERTTEYISENPVKSTLVSFGIGMLAGAIVMKLLEKK